MMISRTSTRFFLPSLLLGLFFIGTSCESESAQPSSSEQEDFAAFYQRFLNDADYQMAHIVFPLEGIPAGAESQADMIDFKWSEADWQPHRPMDPIESGFESEFIELEPGLMVERIMHNSGSYGMMRRFARLGNDWYLIYYAGMNALRQ